MSGKFIEKFVEEVLKNTNSFSIEWKEGCKDVTNYHFVQDKVGKARYVYGSYSWNDELFFSGLKNSPKLVAIVSDDTVYIVDEYVLKATQFHLKGESFPLQAVLFDDYVKEVTRYANEEVLKDYIASLDIPELPERFEKSALEKAREILLRGGTTSEKEINPLSRDEIAEYLCGFYPDLAEKIVGVLNRDRELWSAGKAFDTQVNQILKEPDLVAERWEIEMAKGLREVPDAKSVNVEFVMNGSKANGKMEPSTLMRKLIGDGRIDDYDFINCSEGKRLYYLFGAYYYKNPLTCKHITKITYGKRLLFDERLVEVDE